MTPSAAECIRDAIPLTVEQGVAWARSQPTGQRALVCGSRDARPRGRAAMAVRAILTALRPSSVAHGAAPGVDSLADEWAWWHDVEAVPFVADWNGRGHAAGPERNERMAAESGATLCLAIHHGTRGTADMCRRARAHGITVCEVWP